MAAKKKDIFDEFLDKSFAGADARVKIARPVGGDRDTSFEERRRMAEEADKPEVRKPDGAGEGSAAAEQPSVRMEPAAAAVVQSAQPEVRRPGRPKSDRGPVVNMNFLLEVEAKQKLERLKVELYRSSVTDLFKEAIRDLFVKYNVE